MTRSGAPFHGAHGEGRSAISPAASQAGAEPCARAFPAARARRNAPVISDNAVVAAPMNWRAESTGDPLPLSRPATQLAEIMAKVDRPCGFRLRCSPGTGSSLRPGSERDLNRSSIQEACRAQTPSVFACESVGLVRTE